MPRLHHTKEKLNRAQSQLLSRAGKAMFDWQMLCEGARIGVAVSGGVDSFTLLRVLELRRAGLPFPVELFVIHINPGFDAHNHRPLVDYCTERGLAARFETTDHGPHAHSDKNTSGSPCFLCAWMRRKRFFEVCRTHNLTHLAIGHTADDLASTFFMNIFNTGRVKGLSGNELFFNGRLRMIRPLITSRKADVERAARGWNLPIWKNTCPSAHIRGRAQTEHWLAERYASAPSAQSNVLHALTRWQLDADGENTYCPHSDEGPTA